ncbi:hypothetical protein CsatB_027679 [Cannabis sativa]
MAAYFKSCYEDFEPFCKWQRGQERDILELHLQGFKKENLRVQVNTIGILTISGENTINNTHVDNNIGTKKIRFRKEIKIEKECKTDQIRAKFTKNILYITIPKIFPINNDNNITLAPPRADKPDQTINKGSGIESIRGCSSPLGEYGMIGKNVALGVAVVVVVGIIVGGFFVWNWTSKPPILIY